MAKNSVIIGIGLMVLAFLSGKDGLVKSFLHQVDPFQIIWMQFTGTFLVMALIAFPTHGLRVFRPRPLGGQFREALNISAVASPDWALTYIPLADATAMLPSSSRRRWRRFLTRRPGGENRLAADSAVIVGFCGVLIILRPGFAPTRRAITSG